MLKEIKRKRMLISSHNLDKPATLNWQRGHAQANDYQTKERITMLSRLTPEQARAMFISLYSAGKVLMEAGSNLDALERLRVERLVERRCILDRLAVRSMSHD